MSTTSLKNVMLTTYDNNVSPFEDYDEWKREDERLCHFTEQLVGQFTVVPYETSQEDYENAILEAYDEITELFPNIYLKVYRT